MHSLSKWLCNLNTCKAYNPMIWHQKCEWYIQLLMCPTFASSWISIQPEFCSYIKHNISKYTFILIVECIITKSALFLSLNNLYKWNVPYICRHVQMCFFTYQEMSFQLIYGHEHKTQAVFKCLQNLFCICFSQ